MYALKMKINKWVNLKLKAIYLAIDVICYDDWIICSFGVCLVLGHEFFHTQILTMLTILFFHSSLRTNLKVFLYHIFCLLNHLHHILFLSVPFYLLYLPFVNLRPQLFNFFYMRFNVFIDLFFTEILFLKLFEQGLIDFFQFFSLLQDWVNTLANVFHLTFQTVGLFLFMKDALKLGLVFGKFIIMFLFHGLDEVKEKLVSLCSVFLLCLKNWLVVTDGELDLILKRADLLLYFSNVRTKRLWVFIFWVTAWVSRAGATLVDFVAHMFKY